MTTYTEEGCPWPDDCPYYDHSHFKGEPEGAVGDSSPAHTPDLSTQIETVLTKLWCAVDIEDVSEELIDVGEIDDATQQIKQLIESSNREAVLKELNYIKDLDESADYEQDGKSWTGLAIPRNKIIDRIKELS